MNIAEQLKKAILEDSWGDVYDVYHNLTGERLINPHLVPIEPKEQSIKTKKSRPKKTDSPLKPLREVSQEDFRVVRPEKKNTSIKATGKNLFDPGIKVELDPAMEKINDNIKPSPRLRPPAKLVEVFCADCGKPSEVSPSLAKSNFRCDNCLLKKVK